MSTRELKYYAVAVTNILDATSSMKIVPAQDEVTAILLVCPELGFVVRKAIEMQISLTKEDLQVDADSIDLVVNAIEIPKDLNL